MELREALLVETDMQAEVNPMGCGRADIVWPGSPALGR